MEGDLISLYHEKKKNTTCVYKYVFGLKCQLKMEENFN